MVYNLNLFESSGLIATFIICLGSMCNSFFLQYACMLVWTRWYCPACSCCLKVIRTQSCKPFYNCIWQIYIGLLLIFSMYGSLYQRTSEIFTICMETFLDYLVSAWDSPTLQIYIWLIYNYVMHICIQHAYKNIPAFAIEYNTVCRDFDEWY